MRDKHWYLTRPTLFRPVRTPGTTMKINSPAQARWATFTVFLFHGIMLGSWVPHIPLAKERLDVGPAVFGLALLAIAAGAVTAMPLTGAMINRYGSARV